MVIFNEGFLDKKLVWNVFNIFLLGEPIIAYTQQKNLFSS